jgi:hypothetical protein
MSKKDFIKVLAYSVLCSVLVYSILCFFVPIYKYLDLSLIGLVFFSALSVLIYVMGERALRSKKTNSFLTIIVLNTFIKLMGSFILVLLYVKIKEPDDKNFLIPFLLIYLVFMISETYFLSVQSRQSRVI